MLDHLRRLLPHTTRAGIATGHVPHACLPTVPIGPSPRRREGSRVSLTPRHRLPVALVRLLGADCAACRGIGCRECAHTGLG